MEKIKITQVIVAEGKYDKIKLSSVADATIITLDGFGIFNNSEKQFLLRELAKTRGLIIFTDSDPAGGFLRAKLRGMLPKEGVFHLYAPQVKGKEKRKSAPSKAGLLGVEGIDAEKLREILKPFAVNENENLKSCPLNSNSAEITKTDFYVNGLSGSKESAKKRVCLAKYLGLPREMTANAMIEAMNLLGKSLPPEEEYFEKS